MGIKRIVKRHARRMERRHLCLVNEKSPLVHVVVSFGSGSEVRPDRNHQVKMVFVEILHHPRRIGIAGLVKDRLAHGVPPEPILYDAVRRNAPLAIFVRHPQQLLLRVVFVLRLPETVSPFSEQWRRSGQLAVSGDDAVELRPVEQVVVHLIGSF